MQKPISKRLDPVATIIAIVILLMGMALVILGCLYVQIFGWIVATIIIVSGLSSVGLSVTAIITGKREWLLIDLILPM